MTSILSGPSSLVNWLLFKWSLGRALVPLCGWFILYLVAHSTFLSLWLSKRASCSFPIFFFFFFLQNFWVGFKGTSFGLRELHPFPLWSLEALIPQGSQLPFFSFISLLEQVTRPSLMLEILSDTNPVSKSSLTHCRWHIVTLKEDSVGSSAGTWDDKESMLILT